MRGTIKATVLNAVKAHPGATKLQLAEITGLTYVQVKSVVHRAGVKMPDARKMRRRFTKFAFAGAEK